MAKVLGSALPTAAHRLMLPWLVVVATMLWVFRETAASMVAVWSRSDTFMHGYLVVPIAMWLAWRKREALAGLPIRPVPWLLGVAAVVCLLWLLGRVAAVGTASQWALAALIVLTVPTFWGWQRARVLAFALLFVFFAVPAGEFAVPTLMSLTADFTVSALRMVGVPVFREGLEFVIPSGHWSVVEACSGLRYLIASTMVGTLYAYLMYQGSRKRLLFVAASIVVPILANWFRAFLIVLLGHVSNNALAGGVDHLIYGWVFFGLVMGAMFAVGWRWADPEPELARVTPDVHGVPIPVTKGVSVASMLWMMSLMLVATMAATAAWSKRMDEGRADARVQLTAWGAVGDWTRSPGPEMPWTPNYIDPSASASFTYMRGEQPVWVWVGQYLQPEGKGKLISTSNSVTPAQSQAWSSYDQGLRAAGTSLPAVRTEVLRHSKPRAVAAASANDVAEGVRYRVWSTYRLGDEWMTSDARIKVKQALQRITHGHGDGAIVVIATTLDERADHLIEAFLQSHLLPIERMLEGAVSKANAAPNR